MEELSISGIAKGVISWTSLKNLADTDPSLIMVAGMTLGFVRGLPIWQAPKGETVEQNDDRLSQVHAGAVMLASRLYRRRASPGGIEQMTDAGVTYVARHDSDVSRMLRLDSYAAPAVG